MEGRPWRLFRNHFRSVNPSRHWTDVQPIQAPRPIDGSIRRLSLATLAEVEASIRSRQLTHEDRADGRVISPRPVRPNIHD
jgi:hypothetical protein